MTGQTLFDQIPPAQVRYNDPDTSRRAARQQRGAGVPPLILEVFALGVALTDDELAARLPGFLSSTVKTARSRLTKVVPPKLVDTTYRRPGLVTGSLKIVWKAAPCNTERAKSRG